MRCKDCPRYLVATEKCADGKVNPDRWELAVTVAQVMGLRAICTYNDHRERLIGSRNVGGRVRMR